MYVHNPERGDRVASESRQRKGHRSEVVSRNLKLLENVKVEDINKVACINHDPLHSSNDHPYRDDQCIIVVWVEVLSLSF